MSRKQMTAQESLAAAQEYYRLMRAGLPSSEAFARAYPNGIPSQQDRLKDAAKEEQSAALAGLAGQVGGTVAGVYGAGKLASALGFGSQAAGATGAATGAAGAGAAGTAAAGTGAAGAGTAGAAGTTGAGASMASAAPIAGAALAAALAGRYGIRALQGKTDAWQDASLADNAGRGILAIGTGGLSEVAGYLGNKFGGDKNRWQTERNRLEQLKEQGFTGLPDYSGLSGGRSKAELVQLAKDTGGNVEFAQSRNESSLTPQDIAGYASIIERAGKDATLDDRLKLAAEALSAGAVREHHGTIDVDWNKVQSPATAAPMKQLPGQVAPEQLQGLAAALTPMMQQQPDAGTLRRWRLGFNG